MFDPWIGSDWGKVSNPLQGFRLLVLGESHHSDPEDVGKTFSDMTNEVVRHYLDANAKREPWMRTFSRITGLLAGRPSSAMTWSEVDALWRSIVFYNYVPVVAAGGPRQRPSSNHFKLGAEPLRRLLSLVEPDAIVVCGKDLSGWVVRGEGMDLAWELTNYQVQGVPAAMVHHPSTSFSYLRWWPVLESLIAEVRTKNLTVAHGWLQ